MNLEDVKLLIHIGSPNLTDSVNIKRSELQ